MKQLLLALAFTLSLHGQGMMKAINNETHASSLPTYTIIQFSCCDSGATSALASNQTVGNTNISLTDFCREGSCAASGSCPSVAFTDNAGSHGAGGNNTYGTDFANTTLGGSITNCVAVGSAVNIAHTTSTVTITGTATSPFYQVMSAVEVNGLGTAPVIRTGTGAVDVQTAMTSINTGASCTAGDFAIAQWYAAGTLAAGSGWTAIGSTANAVLLEWKLVTATGVVTATSTGASGATTAVVACYHA